MIDFFGMLILPLFSLRRDWENTWCQSFVDMCLFLPFQWLGTLLIFCWYQGEEGREQGIFLSFSFFLSFFLPLGSRCCFSFLFFSSFSSLFVFYLFPFSWDFDTPGEDQTLKEIRLTLLKQSKLFCLSSLWLFIKELTINWNLKLQVIREEKISSFLQVRGSIPLLWQQRVNLNWNPPLEIQDSAEENAQIMAKHLETLVAHYGDLVLLNLVANRGLELHLKKAMEEAFDSLSHKR